MVDSLVALTHLKKICWLKNVTPMNRIAIQYIILYGGLISRGKNLKFSWILHHPQYFNYENFHYNGIYRAIYIVVILSEKSFYYPIHENFHLKINPLYGSVWTIILLQYYHHYAMLGFVIFNIASIVTISS